MRGKPLLFMVLTLILAVFYPTVPVSAELYLPPEYSSPSASELQNETVIVKDANNFIRLFYGFEEDYFVDPAYINHTSVPLRIQKDYNISDLEGSLGGPTAPIIYYYKEGGGPGRDQQYLGQTREGYTITNVRFPMVANWRFIEDLPWCGTDDEDAKEWWKGQGNEISKTSIFNLRAEADPEFAQILDTCIGMAIIPQLRSWDGKQYFMSKSMARPDGNPATPSDQRNFQPDLVTSFPWHNYVHILVPPTFNTWGYGIGFYVHNGKYTYKSFPITPLSKALVPDFFPTPGGVNTWTSSFATCARTYIGQPGELINVPVSLHNAKEKSATDFAATWYGSSDGHDPRSQGWERPLWKVEGITLGKGEKQDFVIPVTVPEPGQETRLVFRTNINGETPVSELNQSNNMMIIKVTSRINLVAVEIKSGVSGSPVAGKRYTASVTFKNDSEIPLKGVPVAAYNTGWRAALKDPSGNTVTQTDFLPGEIKRFTFQWTLPASTGYSKLEGMINVSPLATVYQETTFKDNKVQTVVSAPVGGGGAQELTFQAWRQWSFIDVMGKPREYRKPNTARYTDIVETTLTPTNVKKVKYTVSKGESVDHTTTIAPPAPTCGDSCGAWNTLTDWEITRATLHYPAKSDGFTFGHPIWNNDWTSKPMKPQGKTAQEKFKEEWAMDGAPVFDRVINDFVGPPKYYTLRADYTIRVTYDRTCGYLVCETDEDGNTTCWCEYETTPGLTATYNYTGTGKILIDGTGAAPVPTQYVGEFKDTFPHLVEVPY